MLRGVFFTPNYFPHLGGGIEHAHQVVTRLNSLGVRVAVVTTKCPHYFRGRHDRVRVDCDVESQTRFDLASQYPIYRYTSLWRSGYWGGFDAITKRMNLLRMISAVLREKADFIIFEQPADYREFQLLASVLLSRRPFIRVVHHFAPHDMSSAMNRLGHRAFLRFPSPVIVVSRSTATDAEDRGVPPELIRIAENAVDTEAIRTFRESSREVGLSIGDGPVLLTVCRMWPTKGVDRVINVMPRIRERHPDVQYVVVGDGPELPRLRELAANSTASDAIHFLGSVTEEMKFALYQASKVFVMPSLVEGFGLVFLEANAFGKPAVGVDLMGTPEAILDGTTGLLAKPHDDDSLADAVLKLLDNPEYAERLGQNGRRRVERDFSWDRTAEKYRAVIREVTGV